MHLTLNHLHNSAVQLDRNCTARSETNEVIAPNLVKISLNKMLATVTESAYSIGKASHHLDIESIKTRMNFFHLLDFCMVSRKSMCQRSKMSTTGKGCNGAFFDFLGFDC